MPDHLHLIISGQTDTSDALKAVSGFKYKATSWVNEHRPEFALQDGWYDHIIRASEDWRSQLTYVYLNPVRAGLVADPDDYPFTGAIGSDLKESIIEAHY